MTVGPGSRAGDSGPGFPVTGGAPGYPAGGIGPGHALASNARAQMRVSTLDRDRAVELLAQAFAEGRLPSEEHEARMARAMSATTFADLDAVVADLPGGGAPVPPKTNQLAIAALVCGVGQVALWPLISFPAIVLGHMARRQIRRTGESGAGMALAGLILGWVGLTVTVLLVALLVIGLALFTGSSATR